MPSRRVDLRTDAFISWVLRCFSNFLRSPYTARPMPTPSTTSPISPTRNRPPPEDISEELLLCDLSADEELAPTRILAAVQASQRYTTARIPEITRCAIAA